jgi:uncharacterized protein (TIGR02757 family)
MTPRERRVKGALDAVRARCDVAARTQADPVGFVHRYVRAEDKELVALVAACIAFGNVKMIRAKLDELLRRVGPAPARLSDQPEVLLERLRGWKSRVFQGEDLARLLAGARAVQRRHGSLGAFFEGELARADAARADAAHGTDRAARKGDARTRAADADALRSALAAWCDAIREAGGLRRDGKRRGPAHLLPDPRGASGCKRLLLFLRWMVRPSDGVDLGMWNVDPARLLIPVDVHIHRLAGNLGLTRRPATSWTTTVEITGALARLDARDPAGYDFSLCHMGMLQRCPSKKVPALCAGCGVKPVCIHWGASEGPAGALSS